MSVVIETTLGDVTVDLFVEQRPQTCLNFLKLCKIKYYNLNLFHNVTANFLAQTGDPTGKGDGGESVFGVLKGKQHRLYQAEKLPRIKHNRIGLLSMVSHGDGMLGSQFVITLSPDLSSLDQEHCVFGQVIEGEELLLKLNEAITDDQHRPYQDIRITHTVILEDPFPDPEGLEVPPLSPMPPSQKDIAYSRIPADEPLTDNYSQEELDEMVQQREAAARAAILEMVGDIPDAEAAPPENVLFVCKLNPVTSDHDLSIIFSRFGTVKSCEVIRDQVSGDSLQYAFVEFEDRKACEDAYFKMDNVLIDDRRIHVDFSQSVAKLKWKGKGRGVEMLGPPPPGGWGNGTQDRGTKHHNERNFNNQIRKKPRQSNEERRYCEPNPMRNGKGVRGQNEVQVNHRKIKVNEKRDSKRKEKSKRRKSSSSSSSSDSSSETSSSSESSESSYGKKKKSRSSRRVLVVVKTPRRGKTHKKPRKVRKKHPSESDTDSHSDAPKKKKKKVRKESSSSDDSSTAEERKKKKRKRSPSTEVETKTKKKKKKAPGSDSSASSSDEKRKSKARKRRSSSESSSDSETRTKKKKKDKAKIKKKKQLKKPKKRHRRESNSSSSSD